MTTTPQDGPVDRPRLGDDALAAAARDHLWMHFTRHSTFEQGGAVPIIARGEGAYIWDSEGRRYLDELVDELARGRPMAKVLRQQDARSEAG